MKLLAALALMAATAATAASAQSPGRLDSARVTVSPECGAAECWPWSVVIGNRGAMEFVQALKHSTTTLDAATTGSLFASADSATITPLPERIDRDPLLCPAALAHQPVITVALYRGATEWRFVDFRWCQPTATADQPTDRASIAELKQLRAFEDAVRALPFVVAHDKP